MASKMNIINKNVSSDTSSSNQKLHNLALNINKAGMEGLDTAKINEIIQKASEGSKFYLHKQKCQERLNEKIQQMKKLMERFTEEQIEKAEAEMTKIGQELSKSRDLSKTIVHIDMDMFFAAVEMRDNPSLKEKPMAVGSTAMLSTSNYVARKFGVRAAMPGFIGLKLCPDLVIVRSNFSKYKEVSHEIQEIFKEYDPNFAPMSLDEAYLDITEFIENNGHKYQKSETKSSIPEEIVNEIRTKIEKKTQLTASAGIAPNTRLAKVCSDLNKPNGQYYLHPNEQTIMEFVDKLPIRKVSGIGGVSEQHLKALGIEMCSDLWKKRGQLRLLFTETSYLHFLHISLGLGSTVVEAATKGERKSISTETTFKGTSDPKTLFTLCEDLCRELQEDMEAKEMVGRVFTLKLKTTDFQVRTRAHTLLETTSEAEITIPVASKLLQNEMDACTSGKPLSLRLLGVRMSGLFHKCEVSPKKQQTITGLFQKVNKDDASKKLFSPTKELAKNTKTADNKKEKKFEYNFASYKEWKNRVNGEPHICPVCSHSLYFENLEKFNDHVFNCLKINCKDSKNDNLTNNQEESIASTLKMSLGPQEEEDIEDELNSAFISDNDFSSVIESNFVASENSISSLTCPEEKIDRTSPNKPSCSKTETVFQESSNNLNKESFKCPVCLCRTFSDNLSLNLHLDLCLNGTVVKQLVKESNQIPIKKDQNTCVPKTKSTKRKMPQNKKKEKHQKSSAILHKFLGIQ